MFSAKLKGYSCILNSHGHEHENHLKEHNNILMKIILNRSSFEG